MGRAPNRMLSKRTTTVIQSSVEEIVDVKHKTFI